jgi:hypothetical protein
MLLREIWRGRVERIPSWKESGLEWEFTEKEIRYQKYLREHRALAG